jgi:hypothetical protein
MSRATSPEAIEPPIGLVEGPFRIATDDQAMIEWPRATLTRVWKIANREDASQESKEEWLQRQFGEKKILYFHIDGTNYYLWIVDGIVMPVVSGLHEIWQIEGVDHLFKNMSSVSSTAKRVTLHAQGGDVAYVVELDFTRGCEISSHRVFSGP